MKIKLLPYLTFIFMLFGCFTYAQNTNEREHRIRKVQFPQKALDDIQDKIVGAKRFRFYKEIDSGTVRYKTKFKKDRLWYGIKFDKTGNMKAVNILINSIDIPNDAFSKITGYFATNFSKYKIREIRQKYPINKPDAIDTTIKNAFQNLILPSINYELLVKGKKEKKISLYEVLFDSKGNFKVMRKSLPPNYDHVLY